MMKVAMPRTSLPQFPKVLLEQIYQDQQCLATPPEPNISEGLRLFRGRLPLFTQSPRRGVPGNSRFPAYTILGNSDQRKARVSGLPCPFFLLAASIDEVDAGDDEGRADQ